MSPLGNYVGHLVDPDIFVNWDNVIQVLMFSNKPVTCPICLSPTSSPKITKCGHVYCWPCILHYLQLSEKSWRKCPICYDSVYSKDLKFVLIQNTPSLEKASSTNPLEMNMCLMKRHAHSTLALPRIHFPLDCYNESLPSAEESFSFQFSKHMVASQEYILRVIESEEDELIQKMKQLKQESEALLPILSVEYESELPFMEMAMQELNKIKADFNTKTEKIIGNKDQDGFFHTALPQADLAACHRESKENLADSIYYFYMAADGQHYYLHPLDIKILKHEFNEYSNFPDDLLVKIICIQESTVDAVN
jgi:hypothetical protein